jgi:hypothetical protein
MTTFAVTDLSQVVEATNYLLSNLGQSGNGQANVANAVTINTQTGVIGQGGVIIGYFYQYLNIAYADSSDGGLNFSINRFDNAGYYGVYNNAANPAPDLSNPANYQWTEITGGLGTTKNVYYSTLGGRQISFIIATTVPGPGFVITSDGVPIDLDFVTNTASLPIVIATAFYDAANANIAPPTPTGGTYDFANLIFTAPTGWTNSIPANNIAFFSSQNTFEATGNGLVTVGPSYPWTVPVLTGKLGQDGTNGNNGANGVNGNNGISTYFLNTFFSSNTQPSAPSGGYFNFSTGQATPPTNWSNTPVSANGDPIWASSVTLRSEDPNANVSIGNAWSATYQYTGAGGAPGSRGPIPMAYVVTPDNPLTANSTQLSQWFQSPTTGNTAPIGAGLAPVDQDTAAFTYETVPTIVRVATYYSANTSWANANGQVIPGSLFVTGSINANALNTNEVYTLTLKGGNAVVGNVNSGGFWANALTGDARFAGNFSIGNNARIGNSLTIGNSVTIGGVTANGVLLNNIISSAQLQNNSVVAGKIANNAVTLGDIAQGSVDSGAILSNAVIASKIAAGAITAGKIAANAVTAGTIAANAVVAGSIAANAVIASSIAAEAITAGKIAAGAVTATALAAGSVVAGKIAADAIGATNIAAGAITAGKIDVGAVTASTIAAGAVTTASMSANSISGDRILTGSLSANKIVANSITATQISAAYVYSGNIQSFGAVQGDNNSPGYWLAYNTGNARFGGNVSIGANLTVAGLISASNLNANTVNTNQIVPSAVTSTIITQQPFTVMDIMGVGALPNYEYPVGGMTANLITSSGTTITTSNPLGQFSQDYFLVGANVSSQQGGQFAPNTYITAIISDNSFTVSAFPTTPFSNGIVSAVAPFGSAVGPYTFAATTGANDIVTVNLTSVNLMVARCNSLGGAFADFSVVVRLYRSPYNPAQSPLNATKQLLYYQVLGTPAVFVSGVNYSFTFPVSLVSILDQPGSAGDWVYWTSVKWIPLNGSFNITSWTTNNWNFGATVYKR